MLRCEESGGTLEEQLLEAGNALFIQQPPHLLSHLHRVGKLLGKVEQSPSKSMLDALSPTIKAVVEQQLLRNENEDVRVAVASCISEITRITAPVAPYEDNQMKEVFQLIVSSFENLSDNSSRLYSQRISILETVAKVRSCVVMLDLECDGLIIEMFQHFLKAVRDHHVENVFSNMETVMTLVLEESEEIRLDLISPLLASLKKDSQEVQPIARKLAESVIEKCSAKVKPCLLQAKNLMSFSFDDYSPIISTVCMEANETVQEDHRCPGEQLAEGITDGATSGVTTQGDGDKLYVPSSEEVPQGEVNKESTAEIVEGEDRHAPVVDFGSGEDHHAPVVDLGLGEDHSHVPIETDHPIAMETDPVEETNTVRGGVASERTEIEDNPHTPEKPAECNSNEEDEEEDHLPSHYDDVANLGGGRADEPAPDSDCGKVKFISAQISKKRSKKLMKCTLPLVSSHSGMDKNDKAKHMSDEEGINNLDEVAVHKDDKKEASQLSSSPTEPESEQEILISSSPRGSALDEGLSCKDMRSKKKNGSIKKEENVTATKKAKKPATSDSPPPARKAQVPIKTSRVERGASGSDSDTKVLKKSGKKTDARNYHTRDGTSSKKNVDGKKRVSDKDAVFPVKPLDEVKGYTPLEETPKTSSKRKRAPCKEKATDVKKYGEDLVGSRIKVWWPIDKIFYEGVVESFDPKTKKHKVIYTDGDLEHLNLGEEKWELNKDDDDSTEEGQETRPVTAKITREMRKQKKAKSDSQPSDTEGKAANFRDGDASSSKYKGAVTKSSRKSVDNSKDVKRTKVTPRSSSKSEDVGGKSTKVGSKKSAGGKSEQADNSEDEDGGSLKALIKFKLGTPTKASKDKSKTASIGSGLKSNTSKSGSTKSSRNSGHSQKSIETKEKEKSTCMVVKASESGKVKSAESRRKGGKDTEERSRGKKRRRN